MPGGTLSDKNLEAIKAWFLPPKGLQSRGTKSPILKKKVQSNIASAILFET